MRPLSQHLATAFLFFNDLMRRFHVKRFRKRRSFRGKRSRMSRRSSRRSFSRGANRIHRRNLPKRPMRGGFRL